MQGTQVWTTTELGSTGLEITPVGLGAWAIGGGDWEFGWGPQQTEHSIEVIHRALDLGVNWIDTAAAYGFGRSERVVGRALEGRRDRPYLFTKASLVEGPGRRVVHDLTRESIRREVGSSLERLGVDVRSRLGGELEEYPDVELVTIDATGLDLEPNGRGIVKATGLATALTADGSVAFAGFYEPGTAFDPVSFKIKLQIRS